MSPLGSTAAFERCLCHVRYHPNSGAKADIPGLRIWTEAADPKFPLFRRHRREADMTRASLMTGAE